MYVMATFSDSQHGFNETNAPIRSSAPDASQRGRGLPTGTGEGTEEDATGRRPDCSRRENRGQTTDQA